MALLAKVNCLLIRAPHAAPAEAGSVRSTIVRLPAVTPGLSNVHTERDLISVSGGDGPTEVEAPD